MRCLTVRQPWALHIMQSGKDVENRTRNIAGTYRGPIVIHAAKVADEEAMRALPPLPPNGIPRIFYYGAALGIVELTGVHDSSECWDADFRRLTGIYRAGGSAAIADFPDNGAGGLIGKTRHCSTWALPDHQHLALANPRYFPEPIPYRGALGLWTFPDELLPEVAW